LVAGICGGRRGIGRESVKKIAKAHALVFSRRKRGEGSSSEKRGALKTYRITEEPQNRGERK